jgi:hypothetical protein
VVLSSSPGEHHIGLVVVPVGGRHQEAIRQPPMPLPCHILIGHLSLGLR